MRKNYTVSVKNLKEAEMFRQTLLSIGEKVRDDYFTNTSCTEPDLDYRDGGWILGISGNKKSISFFDLVKTIVNLPKEKEIEINLKGSVIVSKNGLTFNGSIKKIDAETFEEIYNEYLNFKPF